MNDNNLPVGYTIVPTPSGYNLYGRRQRFVGQYDTYYQAHRIAWEDYRAEMAKVLHPDPNAQPTTPMPDTYGEW